LKAGPALWASLSTFVGQFTFKGLFMGVLTNFIKKDSLCFDIGAYVLEKSNEMILLGARRVIAVEPQASLLQIKSSDKITLVEKAVSKEVGFIDFAVCQNAYTISTASPHWKQGRFYRGFWWADPIKVPCTTLDELISVYGIPNYCKIDVEGHEKEVLQGLHHQIPCLSFEFTVEFLSEAFECINLLGKLGKYTFNFTANSQNPDKFYLTDFVSADKVKEELTLARNSAPDFWGDVYASSL
jgi:FkbM family methyltransferase